MSHIAGHTIRVTYGGRTVDAEVVLASPCGRSLFLRFDAMLGDAEGMYFGQMPVLQDDAGVYRDLIRMQPVLIAEATS